MQIESGAFVCMEFSTLLVVTFSDTFRDEYFFIYIYMNKK